MIRAQGWIGATTLLAVATLALSACRRGGDDPLVTSSGADAVFAVVTCEHANPDGSCNKATCKEDQQGNCQKFGEACIKHDYHYSGTAKEGTCSRVL